MSKGSANRPPLYQPLDFAMVRVPLLPVERYLSLKDDTSTFALLDDPRVRRALASGSVSLLHALERFGRGELTAKDADRLRAKALRYEIRMSTRPTPYGLFAGCANIRTSARTDLRVVSSFGASRTRPDMAWLMDLVTAAEAEPAIRRGLRLVRNPLVRQDGERIYLDQKVSVRATGVVKHVVGLCRRATPYREIVDEVLRSSSSATSEKVDRLLTDLWQQSILLTDLRPPLTTDDPARYVLDRLGAIPEAADFAGKLARFLDAASAWDAAPHDQSTQALQDLLQAANVPEDGSKSASFQVDLHSDVQGSLGVAVAKEAAAAAELLLRLSPGPRGLPAMAAYRSAFLTRYGREREVPLLELLDPDRGLGAPGAQGHAFTGPDQAKAAQRSQTLLELACTALHHRQRVVNLDAALRAKLETWPPEPSTAPLSLDINVLVGASSAEAVDRGDFTLVVGPNLGGWAAGRNFGRFAYLEPPETGVELLHSLGSAEELSQDSGDLWAEVAYLPANVRSANVAVRPAIRSHEVVFGVSPGVPEENVIPLDELVAGVEGDRFYVRWPARGKRVRFASGHMLNHHGAPAVAQFLLQVAYEGLVQFSSFDWGPAESFPYLPRVQAGRIVLRPAEWKLAKESSPRDPAQFARFREEWELPRYVCLSFGDNRLVLDLELEAHVRQILAEIEKLPQGQRILLQEVLPALDEAWLEGNEGHFYSEFIVPLLLRPEKAVARSAAAGRIAVPEPQVAAGSSIRRFAPGSEWLFAKLYGPTERQDELIAGSLPAFAENVLAGGLAESWFFIRYADPEPHLRVRFHGDPERLASLLFGQTCRWAEGLLEEGLCTRLAFDTYDREIERFGGPDGMELAERLFWADSESVARVVQVLKAKEWSGWEARMALFSVSIDDLLSALGIPESERLKWYKTQSPAGSDTGAEYRKLKPALRSALGDTHVWLRQQPCGDALESALRLRRQRLGEIGARIRALAESGALAQSELYASFVHLHVNRLGDPASERLLMALLARTRESLAKTAVQTA